MENQNKIDQLIDDTLNSISTINSVKAPPFFKEKVLRRLQENEVKEKEGVVHLNWFNTNYQAAALICFVFLNAVALVSYSSDSYSEDVNSFAQVYGLSETESDAYLYKN